MDIFRFIDKDTFEWLPNPNFRKISIELRGASSGRVAVLFSTTYYPIEDCMEIAMQGYQPRKFSDAPTNITCSICSQMATYVVDDNINTCGVTLCNECSEIIDDCEVIHDGSLNKIIIYNDYLYASRKGVGYHDGLLHRKIVTDLRSSPYPALLLQSAKTRCLGCNNVPYEQDVLCDECNELMKYEFINIFVEIFWFVCNDMLYSFDVNDICREIIYYVLMAPSDRVG